MAAFTELARRHEGKVRTFLARLCDGDGDDLAQETFVKAWLRAEAFRGDGRYEGWLLRIAWRLFLSDRRRRKASVELTEEHPDPGIDPTVAIDANRALAALDERERMAALLCFSHGYSHPEAADIMGLPLGTLKSTVARAKTQLAALLGTVE